MMCSQSPPLHPHHHPFTSDGAVQRGKTSFKQPGSYSWINPRVVMVVEVVVVDLV